MRSRTLRRVIGWAMFAVLVLSVLGWLLSRDTLPREITIATAARGGLYHRFEQVLAVHLERRTGRPVTVVETEGSHDNQLQLISGDVQLAILQSGAVPMQGLMAIAPLYPDVLHVVARRDRGIAGVRDLAGRAVSIGKPGSGMRVSALELLSHYGVDSDALTGADSYFLDLLIDPALDAAIITTGLVNPDLETLLGTGQFELIPILDAEAMRSTTPATSRSSSLGGSTPRGRRCRPLR